MKRYFKIFSILVVLLLLVLIVVPFMFQGSVKERIKDEANKNLNANVNFEDISLGWLSHFPDFSLKINLATISGKSEFELDTLAYLPYIQIDIDPIDLITSSKISIKDIYLDRPVLYVKTLKGGKANYDITLPSETPEVPEDTTADDFSIHLKNLQIDHGIIVYDDYDLDMLMSLQDFNLNLSGDVSAVFSDLKISANAAFLNLVYEGIPLFTDVKLDADLSLGLDLNNFKFTFNDNRVLLNQLPLSFEGWFAMPDDDMNMDLNFGLKESSFKDLLSLVPALYQKDFEELKTFGNMSFTGFAKGTYSDNTLPAFALNLNVDKALFKYPDLPRSAENISMKLEIDNPGGDVDNTTINLKNFHMDFGSNPIDMKFIIKTPVSDPAMNGAIKAKIDFAGMKDVLPVEFSELDGILGLNVDFMGQLSDLESDHPERFKFDGMMLLKNGLFEGKSLPERIRIPQIDARFASDKIELKEFELQAESFDFALNGTISNFIPWMFRQNEILSAHFTQYSERFDASKLMAEMPSDSSSTVDSTSRTTYFAIPENINFSFESGIQHLTYNKLLIKNFIGNIRLRNGKAELEKLSMETLGGKLELSGSYDSKPADHEWVDLDFGFTDINPALAFEQFTSVQKLIPLAKYCQGKLSSTFSFHSALDRSMNPLLEKASAKGFIRSSDIKITSSPLIDKLASLTQNKGFNNPSLKDIYLNFELKEGVLSTSQFTGNLAGIPSRLKGSQNLSGAINYTFEMDIPSDKITSFNSSLIPKSLKVLKQIPFDVQLRGTVREPKLTPSFARANQMFGTTLKETASQSIENQKEKIEDQIDTKKEELLKQAQEKADQLIRDADKAAEKIITEADKKAQALEDAAKNKSMIEKQFAKKAADKIRSEARTKAEKLKAEARQKADELLQKAG